MNDQNIQPEAPAPQAAPKCADCGWVSDVPVSAPFLCEDCDPHGDREIPAPKQIGAPAIGEVETVALPRETALATIEGPGPLAPIPGPIDWSKPLQTKGGHYPVRVIAIDHSLTRPVIGVVGGTESSLSREVNSWHYNGQFDARTSGDCLDLVNVPEVSK
jgi:hypothetical protein